MPEPDDLQVVLRAVRDPDLDVLFEQMRDPASVWMAAARGTDMEESILRLEGATVPSEEAR